MKTVLTLCIVHQHPKVLLALKKRGFGVGKWNGLGGHVEKGEAIEEAARREVFEEAGIIVDNIERRGVLEFEFKDNPEILEVHVFKAYEFRGEPTETAEMKPRWFHIEEIPFDKMWADDRHWLPLFLSGKKFRGRFFYDGEEKIVNQELQEVHTLVNN